MDSRLLDSLFAHSCAGFVDDSGGVSFREAAHIIGAEKHAVELSVKRVENSCADAIHLLSAASGLSTIAPLHSRWSAQERADFQKRVLSYRHLAQGGVWLTTSGSSGAPKIVSLQPGRIADHADAVNAHLEASEDDCWLLCLPLFHVGGFAILPRAALAGSTVRLTNFTDADKLNDIIDHEPITLLSLVPTMLRRLLEQRNGRAFPARLRAILLGGGPISRDLVEKCPQALATYGLTEAGSMVTCVGRDADFDERRTCGRAIAGCDVKVVDETMRECALGTIGRIVVKTRGMAGKYHGDLQQSSKTFRDGWCVTEDMGCMSRAGNLLVLGRADRIVVSGGENIALDEVEASLNSLGTVREAVCVGLEDAEWGQVVGALVVVKEGATLSELIAQLAANLSSHKLPKRWRMASELPLLSSGKPDYDAVRKIVSAT